LGVTKKGGKREERMGSGREAGEPGPWKRISKKSGQRARMGEAEGKETKKDRSEKDGRKKEESTRMELGL